MDINTTRPLFKKHKTENPCTRECTSRTYSCKYDGTCEKYAEWKANEKDTTSKNEYYEPNKKRGLMKISGGRR